MDVLSVMVNLDCWFDTTRIACAGNGSEGLSVGHCLMLIGVGSWGLGPQLYQRAETELTVSMHTLMLSLLSTVDVTWLATSSPVLTAPQWWTITGKLWTKINRVSCTSLPLGCFVTATERKLGHCFHLTFATVIKDSNRRPLTRAIGLISLS